MSVAVVGLSHHSAPIGVRERFVFEPPSDVAALRELTESGRAEEAVVLSTCNRTEFYLATADSGALRERDRERLPGAGVRADDPDPLVQTVLRLFAERAGITSTEAAEYVYCHRGGAAVEHLFRVVTSLDSMILGEAQIQGQVRSAYEAAAALDGEHRVVGPVLSRLFQMALSVGGRVRSETTLGAGAASVPAAAVELAKKIFGPLKGRRALVLGAGEMSRLSLESLTGEGVRSIVVANRTEARARELAERFGGRAARFDVLPEVLAATDIVVTATAAPHALLTRDVVERTFGGAPRQPLLILDIAIPRDVEPSVGEIDNVFVYDIDDLRQIVDDALERRRAEIPVAEGIIREAVDDFQAWHNARDVVPLIRGLRGQAEEVRRSEVEKTMRKLDHLTDDDRELVEQLTRQILNKVLHRPTVRLREAATNGSAAAVVHAARYLFELDTPQTESEGTGRE